MIHYGRSVGPAVYDRVHAPSRGPYIRRVLLGGQTSGARFFRSLLPLPGRVYWPPPLPAITNEARMIPPGRGRAGDGATGPPEAKARRGTGKPAAPQLLERCSLAGSQYTPRQGNAGGIAPRMGGPSALAGGRYPGYNATGVIDTKATPYGVTQWRQNDLI